ncbi:MAG: MoxR family ATPase [Deltaproteobacteria bacterium]|nr:MoxR family ATPase [Deltaproteobacteria bacterium]MBW1900648.1 MoxR family ATPase [Deltaproteobacteria bacterium]
MPENPVPSIQPESETSEDLSMVTRMKEGQEKMIHELKKVIVGQDDVIQEVLIALFAGGHCLITGVPGLAKTLLIKTIADILQLRFNRIQFTPDLMPADVVGTEVIEEDHTTGRRVLKFVKGPIFANILLADEINRTPPKTQSALLEAMEEQQVTAAGVTYEVEQPFFVLATQNPIELEGTYTLPEAQLDRFMFKTVMDYLPEEDEIQVVDNTTGIVDNSVENLLTGEDILNFQRIARQVPAAEAVTRYAVRLVGASRPGNPNAPDFIKELVSWGAGLRASQYLILGGKVRALLNGRYNVSYGDIRALAHPVLRHRIIVNFHAEAERIDTTQIIDKLLDAVPEPASGL